MFLLNDILHLKPKPIHTLTGDILGAGVDHGIVEGAAHEELEGKVVDTLLVLEGLLLLRLVPADDEVVTDGERGTGVGSGVIAVVDGTRECGFDVADNLSLHAMTSASKHSPHQSSSSTNTSNIPGTPLCHQTPPQPTYTHDQHPTPSPPCLRVTYKFPPPTPKSQHPIPHPAP